MMKCLFTRFLLSLVIVATLTAPAIGQKDSTLSEKITKDFCFEFEKASSKITSENMEMEVGLMILPILSKYSAEIKKEWKLDAANQADLRKIGERIGQEAAIGCLPFQKFVMEHMNTINRINTDKTPKEKTEWIAGTLVKVEGQPFTYISFKRTNGKTEKLYWLEYFEGADQLAGDIKKYQQKNVAFAYKELEIFDAVSREYKTIKVITGFEDNPPPPLERLDN